MMPKIESWPTAAVIMTVLLSGVAVLLAGPTLLPEEWQAPVFAGLLSVGTIVAGIMKPLLKAKAAAAAEESE